MAEQEIWKDVQGYEGRYQISSFGRVKVLPFWHNNRFGGYMTQEHIINGRIGRKGYRYVALKKDNEVKEFKVHRLVALHFIQNPYGYPQVNHKDENKLNNCMSNLEWCTNQYNANYGTRTDRIIAARGQKRKERHADRKKKKIIQYDKDGNFIRSWECAKDVKKELRIDNGDIGKCCMGKQNTAGGYKWRYAEGE